MAADLVCLCSVLGFTPCLMRAHTCVCTCVSECVCTCVFICVHMCTHVCVCSCVCACGGGRVGARPCLPASYPVWLCVVAASQNHVEAVYHLGLLHTYGHGVGKDYPRAAMHFERVRPCVLFPTVGCVAQASGFFFSYATSIVQ